MGSQFRSLLQALAVFSYVNSSRTNVEAFSAIPPRSPLEIARMMPSAMLVGELFSNRIPVLPSLITSLIAPTEAARIGVPHAIHSSKMFGNPSVYEGITTNLNLFNQVGSS